MKLETFFAKFDQFADAPDAVAKMRELVLDWAASGKLCHTDSEEWKEGILGDVIELISGQHLLAHEQNEERRGIPYLTDPSDFGEKSPIPARWTDQPKVTAKPGDILITVKGSGVGKTNVLVDQPTAISRQLMAIRVTGADPEFVHVVLKRAAEHFQSAKTGIAIPGIGRREVLGLKVVLPPLAEQKRIVAKVDELMALCDRLEAQQQERETRHAALARASLARFADAPTPANLPFLFHPSYAIPPADLRKSILTLAVQGKLVPQDPNDDLPQIPSDGQTVGDSEWVSRLQLPDTWLWARFEALLAVLKNGFNGKPSKVVGKFRITRIETISRETVDLVRVGYADDLPADVVAKHAVLKGDILFSHINSEPHLGKTAICTIDDPTLVHGVNLLLLRPIAGIDSRYLNIALRELRAAGYFVSIAQRAVNQASINQKNLGKTPIPLPPLAEQRRIVAKVEQLMALVDALETQLAASRATAANLLSALVTELTTVSSANGAPHASPGQRPGEKPAKPIKG